MRWSSRSNSIAKLGCIATALIWVVADFSKTAPAADAPAAPTTESATNDNAAAEKAAVDKELVKLPPALTHYKGREIAKTMHYEGAAWLTRESREREEECSTLLKVLDVKPGQTVCDLGCGNGFYSLPLAKLVGERGKVLAVDIQPEMLRLLSARAGEAEIKNIKPILGTLVDPKLPEGDVDLVICIDVYHEFSHPEQMLAAIRKALKPDGRLVLVEFRLEDPEVPIKLVHKMSKEQVLKELVPNGFKLAGQFDKLPWQHVMTFVRDDYKADEQGPAKAAPAQSASPAAEAGSPSASSPNRPPQRLIRRPPAIK